MSNTQQEVMIYRNKAFSTAQSQFEKDLRKRQGQGWRLASITPTSQGFLTAIYERDTIAINNAFLPGPYPYPASTPLNSPYSATPGSYSDNIPEEIQPESSDMPLISSDEETLAPQNVSYPDEPAPATYSPYESNPHEIIAPSPPLPYNKTLFLGFISAIVLAVLFIIIAGASGSLVPFAIAFSLFGGSLVSMFVIDWKGLLTVGGWIKWKPMNGKQRTGMGCLLYCLFPLFLFIYFIRVGSKVFQVQGPIFSSNWDAPATVKRRANIGLIVGAITALFLILFAAIPPATDTGSNSTSPNTAQTTITTAPTSTQAATPVSTQKPSPTPTPKPTPKPTPTPVPYAHFGDGVYIVGKDIQPGTYRTREGSFGCYFERLSGFGGTLDEIIANDNTDDPAIVTISRSDKGFHSENCGTWTKDLSAITTSKTSFSDGMYIVGTDIKPGTYKSSGQSGCYYARLSGFGGTLDDIIANNNTDSSAIVTISASDKGFQSNNCGTWKRL